MHAPNDHGISAAQGMTRLSLAFLDGGLPPFPFTQSHPGDVEPIFIALCADTWIDTGWWYGAVRGERHG